MAGATTTALLLGGGLFAGSQIEKGGLFGGVKDKIKSPIPLPTPPSVSDAGEKAAEVTKRKRVDLTKSVYTNPLGISGQAQVAKKVLLGQ